MKDEPNERNGQPLEDRRRGYTSQALTILSTIARSSLDALIAIDGKGAILEFGPTAETMYGYRRDEVLGRPVHEVVIPERLRDAHRQGMKNYHATGEGPVLNNRVEVPSVRRDGSEFDAELTVVPFELDGRQLFLAFVRDISERKRHEAEINAARELAEQASEAKSRFLAHMSHEIRSPLNAVLAAVELLEGTTLDPEQVRFARTAGNSGRVLLGLINHILDFSRIEAGQQELRAEPVELRRLVAETLEIARPRAQGRGNLLLAAADSDVPVRVRGDAGVLRQVLVNLVDNANKFTENGVVGVRLSRAGGAEDQLCIEVSDSGIGIPREKLENLFEEFVQADQTHATRFDGTGLGLAIVRRLCELMGGSVEVRSEEGRGSCFRVVLPVSGGEGARAVPGGVFRVLAVADEPLLKEMLAHQVRVAGGTLTVCDAGELDAYAGQAFDRVIADAALMDPRDAAALERLRAAAGERPPCWLLRTPDQHGTLPLPEQEVALTTLVLCPQLVGEPVDPAKPEAPANHDVRVLQGVRILLAEDSMANQLVATAILEKAGAEVHVANDGQEAVECVTRVEPTLILMDLRMPDKDGMAATREIRALGGRYAGLPILALTANAVGAEIQRCLDSGMNDYITKPIEGALLVAKVAEWADRTRGVQ